MLRLEECPNEGICLRRVCYNESGLTRFGTELVVRKVSGWKVSGRSMTGVGKGKSG